MNDVNAAFHSLSIYTMPLLLPSYMYSHAGIYIILLIAFQNYPEDSVREEMRRLLDEKCQYETTAKESLRRVLQEKLDAAAKLADLER